MIPMVEKSGWKKEVGILIGYQKRYFSTFRSVNID